MDQSHKDQEDTGGLALAKTPSIQSITPRIPLLKMIPLNAVSLKGVGDPLENNAVSANISKDYAEILRGSHDPLGITLKR